MAKLKLGDEVITRGKFGEGKPKKVKVREINVKWNGQFVQVNEIDWKYVYGTNVLFDLSSFEWAYAFQISQIK